MAGAVSLQFRSGLIRSPAMKPEPQFLKPGDVVTLHIKRLGQRRRKIVAARK